MSKETVIGHLGDSKLIRGSELLLIVFAAFLLAAALPTTVTDNPAVPVKVNLPAPEPMPESVNASIASTDTSQTTALLAIDVTRPTTATP